MVTQCAHIYLHVSHTMCSTVVVVVLDEAGGWTEAKSFKEAAFNLSLKHHRCTEEHQLELKGCILIIYFFIININCPSNCI